MPPRQQRAADIIKRDIKRNIKHDSRLARAASAPIAGQQCVRR